jgi:PAS domain S-box-containing protein
MDSIEMSYTEPKLSIADCRLTSVTDRDHARVAAEDMLKALSMRTILDILPAGVMVTGISDNDYPIVMVNDTFCAMTGYTAPEVCGRNARFLQGLATNPITVAEISQALRQGQAIRRTLRNYNKDGSSFWNDLTIRPIVDEGGAAIGFFSIQNDISDRRRAQESEQDAQARLQVLADHLPGFIFQRVCRADGEMEFLYCSQSLNRLLGLPPGNLAYRDFIACLHPDDTEMVIGTVDAAHQTFQPTDFTYRLIKVDGSTLWMRGFSTPRILGDGEIVWEGGGMDVTAEHQLQDRLSQFTSHEGSAGLINRVGFETAVETAIDALDPVVDSLTICEVEVELLDEMIEGLGVQLGDTLLQYFLQRLTDFAGVTGTIARISASQFALLKVFPLSKALRVAPSLSAELSRPITVGVFNLQMKTNIGAALLPSGGLSTNDIGHSVAQELLKRSDISLSESKRSSSGEPVLYSQDIDDRVTSRARLRTALTLAVGRNELSLDYQPIYDMASNRIVGAEALLRWRHPELGTQSPDSFIPLAEESGLIIPIGEWVLERAMEQARTWSSRQFGAPFIAVNVSGVQLQRSDFVEALRRKLASTGVDPKLIEIELTEGFLIDGSVKIIEALDAIRALGVRLSIDDFGTGYASYQYLKALSVDKLKIDQIFIRQLDIASSDASILRAIIAMAKSCKLVVVCEGVETQQQREFLLHEGCHQGQGFLFSRPLVAASLETLLRGQNVIGPVAL